MQNVNDVFNYPEEWPLHPEISLFDTTYLFPSVDTVNALSKRVEQLSIDVTTHELKIEIEKLKRKRLGTNLKRTRQSTMPVHNVIKQLQSDCNIMKEQLGAFQNVYASEIARLRIFSSCCLSRINQILISILPYIIMSPGEHHEVAQLVYELLRATQCPKSQNNEI